MVRRKPLRSITRHYSYHPIDQYRDVRSFKETTHSPFVEIWNTMASPVRSPNTCPRSSPPLRLYYITTSTSATSAATATRNPPISRHKTAKTSKFSLLQFFCKKSPTVFPTAATTTKNRRGRTIPGDASWRHLDPASVNTSVATARLFCTTPRFSGVHQRPPNRVHKEGDAFLSELITLWSAE